MIQRRMAIGLMVLAFLVTGIHGGLAKLTPPKPKIVKSYYPNKKIQSVRRFDPNGQMDGPYKLFWPNGRLREKGKYKHGFMVGQPKRYTSIGESL